MRIKKVEIKDYKAFYGKNEFSVDGKNLFIYGENGSGKSSFYYALKDFFQSSTEVLNYNETENIFLTKAQKGKGYIEVTFNPDKDGTASDKKYFLKKSSKNTYVAGDTSIRDAIKLKSFLTYKHLLGIHSIKKDKEIDLFDLLVKGVLKHFKSIAITGSKELGELWEDVEKAISKQTEGTAYNITQKKTDVQKTINVFDTAFKKLFAENSIENILKYAQPILDKFGHNIELKLNYTQAKPTLDYKSVERNHVRVKIKFLGKEIDKPHIFLNEARLSAIAISIYLGMVKRHIQGIPCKVLFLDDIFIGLDISNRLPLLEILRTDFTNYQVFITTYDKPWYEFVKTNYLHNNNNWKCFEIYAGRSKKGFTIPVVKEIKARGNNDHLDYYIQKGENYHNSGDNKAAGVYLRSAFEAILKQFCFGKVTVKFVVDQSKLTANDFWTATKNHSTANTRLTQPTVSEIDNLIPLVLNPLNHNDINKNEHSIEIGRTIRVLKTLKTELRV
ncbi:AAA family ATPase [Algoriphagus lutimaris]|uniref:AAA family ATPase n=1 Tax=Algoriphagus lutimaris TaxID=613197 RepID=UPI00196A5EC4|nr:AAA family ATPase [Algoriphagus lutimaris]MBN3520720.1 AAA family ATPase [Algoriphagus lutimaris]